MDWLQVIHKMWSCSFWTQPQKVVGYHRETHHFSEGKSAKEFTAPQHTRSILPPIHPDKIIAALHGRYFFTNRTLCGCTNLRILFAVVACTTSKCYSCAWKKQDVVSALRPAFFILYLESFISRLNEILRHDLTLSVGEPDNAAAKQGQELRSEQTVTPLHEQHHLYLFLRLNNSEITVRNVFWAKR